MMKHTDESALKAELDDISRQIDEIMKKIDAVLPGASDPAGPAAAAADEPDDS